VDCVKFHQLTAFLKWKIHRKAFAAGAPPRTPLGELTTPPRLPSRLGRGKPPPQTSPGPSAPFGASLVGAFGTSNSAPSAPRT